MPKEQNISQDLYNLLLTRDFDPETTDRQGQATTPNEGVVFSFDYVSGSGRNYGTAVLVITDDAELLLFFGDNLGKSMEDPDKTEWFEFLQQLKQFATRHNFHTFSPQNLNQLKHTMAGMAAIREGLFEGYYGTRRQSYMGEPQQARLVIRHTQDIAEGDARYRHIESIFIETADGERFRMGFRNLAGARAMLEHVRQGGRPYDVRGVHISEMVQEIQLLSRFNRASARRVVEGTEHLVEAARNFYSQLRRDLAGLSHSRGYQQYFEQWQPAEITGSDQLVEDLRSLFVEQRIDDRIEAALPVLAKVEQKMKEVEMFESWTSHLAEGTWNLPDTPEQQKKLQELMGKELPLGPDATNATEQLYDLVGDDELFDILGVAAKYDPDANAWEVPGVRERLQELGVEMPGEETAATDAAAAAATQPANNAQAPAAPTAPVAPTGAPQPVAEADDVSTFEVAADPAAYQQQLLDRLATKYGLPAGSTMDQVRDAQLAILDKSDPAAAARARQSWANIEAGQSAASQAPVKLAPQQPSADFTAGLGAARAGKGATSIMLAQPSIANNQAHLDQIAAAYGLPKGLSAAEIEAQYRQAAQARGQAQYAQQKAAAAPAVAEDEGVAASPRLQRAHQRERERRGLPHPDEYLRMIAQKKKEIEALRREIEQDLQRAGKKDVSEVTGDRQFDDMMRKIKKGTKKQATADRRERERQSREQARAAFGPSPADRLSIRSDKGVQEGILGSFLKKQVKAGVTPKEVAASTIRQLNQRAPGTKMEGHPNFSQFKREVYDYIASAEDSMEAIRRSSDDHVMSLGKKYFRQGVSEMDSQGYRGHRGDEDPGKGPEKSVKPAKAKDVAKDAEKDLAKAMDREHAKKKQQGVAEGSGNNDNNDFYSGLYAELLGDVNNYSVTDMVNTKNSIKRALESGRLSLADVKSEIHQLESELKKQGVAEGGFPGAPDVEMPPIKPSGDPQRDKLRQEYIDIHREIKSLVDIPYRSDTTSQQKARAKARITQLNVRADEIKAALGYDDNWNRVDKGVAEGSKEKTPGVALSKAYKKDFDGNKPGHNQPETALTGTYSKTGKPGGELKKKGVSEAGYNPLDDERREQRRMDQEQAQFKRDELAAELGGEEQRAQTIMSGTWYVIIDGQAWKKQGRPVTFSGRDAARRAGQTIKQRNPGKIVTITTQLPAMREANDPGSVVNDQGLTQGQWIKQHQSQGARIIQSKMVNGPAFARYPDGRQETWRADKDSMTEAQCNHTMEGEMCPKHGLAECAMEEGQDDPMNRNAAITGSYYESTELDVLARIKHLALLK